VFRVFSCLTTAHDWRLVGVAAAICLLGTLTTFLLLDRATQRAEADRFNWIAAAGVATGTSTWATHFVAMLAYDGGMPIGFAFGLTLSSAVIAIVTSLIGYRLACSNPTLPRLALGGAVVGLGIGLMHFTGMAAINMPSADASARLRKRRVSAAWIAIRRSTITVPIASTSRKTAALATESASQLL